VGKETRCETASFAAGLEKFTWQNEEKKFEDFGGVGDSCATFSLPRSLITTHAMTTKHPLVAVQPEPEIPYRVLRTEGRITIDGVLNDRAWESARPLKFQVHQTHEEPVSKTDARMLWDDEYLYVAFRADDKDVWGYLTKRDDPTCLEDCLEVFFKTDPDRSPYYNFEINPLGTVFDAFSPGPDFAGGYHRWKKWDCEGLLVGVNIRGSLNDPSDVDDGWDLEVAIPFRSLPTLSGGGPREGDVWMFHLARYDYSVYLPGAGRELSSTAPLTGPFCESSEWLPLVFGK